MCSHFSPDALADDFEQSLNLGKTNQWKRDRETPIEAFWDETEARKFRRVKFTASKEANE